ncbi:TM2 domain-containing protein biscotti-like [Glandiceps talaboti]
MATSGIFQKDVIFIIVLFDLLLVDVTTSSTDYVLDCEQLLMGQYHCEIPDIDPKTQSARDCDEDGIVSVNCYPAPNISCDDMQFGFQKDIPCRYTNGVYHEVAVLLSVFLGMFGIDRFYLGYPAIGLLKLSTLGFFFLGQLIDIILIASQVVGPADGSEYIIDFFGSRLIHITQDNQTYYKVPDYW